MFLDLIGIGTAFAAEGGAEQAAGGSSGMLLMLAGIFVVFYFLMIRPQTKRAKEQRNLLSQLSVGDEVTTTAGIAGQITEVGTTYIKLEIAKKVEILIQKAAITAMLPKGTLSSDSLLKGPEADQASKGSEKKSKTSPSSKEK